MDEEDDVPKQPQEEEQSGGFDARMGAYAWLTFCAMVFAWFVTKVFRGKRQLHENFHTIEGELRRMQEAMEAKKAQEETTVSVDVWKMIVSMGSYVSLALIAWIFLKLVCACFWLPNYLKKEQLKKEAEEKGARRPAEGDAAVEDDVHVQVSDKKKD